MGLFPYYVPHWKRLIFSISTKLRIEKQQLIFDFHFFHYFRFQFWKYVCWDIYKLSCVSYLITYCFFFQSDCLILSIIMYSGFFRPESLTLWSWSSYLISLSFSIPICKMVLMRKYTSCGCHSRRIHVENYYTIQKRTWNCPVLNKYYVLHK